jgi:hypothetical protein
LLLPLFHDRTISLEVIVRHEMCERPKPGDKCLFTGTLLALPDAATLMMSGRRLNLQHALRDKGRNKDVCLLLVIRRPNDDSPFPLIFLLISSFPLI